jgi:hypothetical protein
MIWCLPSNLLSIDLGHSYSVLLSMR